MSNWTRSNVSREQLPCLVEAGPFLHSPMPSSGGFLATSPCHAPKGYVVSFVAFHERGFSVPAGRFIRGVLFAYGLQLQHLNPNNIQ
jgi:hypothetical protein